MIEVDGGQHYEPEHARNDAERDKCLADMGLLMMRFDNGQVLHETDAVVEQIHRIIGERCVTMGGNEMKAPLPAENPAFFVCSAADD